MKSSQEIGEFNLIDYIRIIWRWKWLIVGGTLAGVLVAGLLTMLSSATYRVVATVDTGDLKQARDRDLERLVARLNAASFDEPAAAGEPAKATVQFRKPYTIEVSAESRHPAGGVATVERATAAALEELNRLHELQEVEDGGGESVLQSRLAALDREQAVREERLQVLRRGLEQLERARLAWARPPGDPVGALLYASLSEQIAMRRQTLNQLEDELRDKAPRERRDLQRQIKLAQLTAQARQPRLAGAPKAAATGRRPWLPLALGMVVGLAGSVLLSMACEYYARGAWRQGVAAREPASDGKRATPAAPRS